MDERNYSIEQVRKAAKENYGSFNHCAKVGYYILQSVNSNDITEIKKPTTKVAGFFLRRKRDSNPRRCDPQQFSRLPHSTTLPFLQWLQI